MSEEATTVPPTETVSTEAVQESTTPVPVVEEPPFPVLVGIDLGNEDIVLAACQAHEAFPAIVRNDTSDTSTKTLLSFKNVERLFGESAAGHVSF